MDPGTSQQSASEIKELLDQSYAQGRAGNCDAAEATFLQALHLARTAGVVRLEVAALHGLGVNAGATGRMFEAFALLRTTAALARKSQADDQLFRALGGLQGAMFCLKLYDEMPPVLDEMQALIERMPPEQLPPWGDREYYEGRYAQALEDGSIEEAQTAFEAYEFAVNERGTRDAIDASVMRIQEARLRMRMDDLEGAERLHREAAEVGADRANVSLHTHVRHAELLAKLGRHDEASAGATKAIALMEAMASQTLTCFDRLDMGAILGRTLKSIGDDEQAHHVMDLAAAAVLERIGQLDSCVERLPELGLEDVPTRSHFIDMRKRFVAEQQELMQYVARMLTAEDGTACIPVRGGTAEFIAICAWCERLRPAGGGWVPVGQFIPRDGSLRITHGICETCMRGLG